MSPAESPATNTLGLATSPYLRQHADNPVHWQQWTPQALAEAAARDVPVLLSIGYAACHWCHVMAHESFEDDEVAAAMNAGFVCIKVDREERPDIDAVYMNATVALTGQGGWPMTCFLTPDGRPFFCGTYYPKDGFLQLLSAVTETWRTRRGEVEEAVATTSPASCARWLPACRVAARTWRRSYATTRSRPCCANRTRCTAASAVRPSSRRRRCSRRCCGTMSAPDRRRRCDAVARTGNAMARGGIYDQLAGGFARYSVDNAWVIPHFEKMLYDNALLLRGYAHWARRTGDPLARRVADQTARFLLDELADARHVHLVAGRRRRRRRGLDLRLDARATDRGTRQRRRSLGRRGFRRHQRRHLRTRDIGAATTRRSGRPAAVRTHPDRAAGGPRNPGAARTRRQGGHSWNGLAITALAEASVALDKPEFAAAARRCATALLDTHVVDGRLRRASLGGVVGDSAAILEDHAMLATGLLALYQLSAEEAWLTTATDLLDTALAHFADPQRPGRWYDTADDAEQLMLRPADPADGATPSGASTITEALLTAAHLVDGDRAPRYLQAAADALGAHSVLLAQAPRSAGHWLAVAEAAVRGPLQIAVAGDPSRSPLLADARRLAPGGAIVVGGEPDSSVLLVGRNRVADADAAYVCRGRVCDLPVTRSAELAAALGVPG